MGTPRPHVSRHVSGRAPRRSRRPRRPVFRSPIAGCTRVLHVCLRRPYFFQQRKKYGKERRPKPMVFGFPLSDYDCGIKRFRIESLVRLSPLPLPRTARVACHDRLRDSAIRAAAAPVFRAAVRWLIDGVLACRSTKYASQQRVFFIFRGPTGRTCTCRRWRHVRDLVIAKIDRTTRPHFALQER